VIITIVVMTDPVIINSQHDITIVATTEIVITDADITYESKSLIVQLSLTYTVIADKGKEVGSLTGSSFELLSAGLNLSNLVKPKAHTRDRHLISLPP
jgi:hypothetical protein